MSEYKPFDKGYLQVDEIHKIYYEQYGQKDGIPVVFVHGGPGGSVSYESTTFFDLEIFRVLIYEQRGSGRSLPTAEIRNNTTKLLIEDLESLRRHIGVGQWHIVFGGSWGSALSLAYAQAYPSSMKSIILRGVLTCRKAEFQFSRGATGAARIYPIEYERFVGHLPPQDREDPIAAYYGLMCSDDAEIKRNAAKEWNRWDLTLTSINTSKNMYDKLGDEKWCLTHAMLETHFFTNGCFLVDGQLLHEENVARIRHLKVSIVEGRFDMFTPPQTAWDLHKQLPGSRLHLVQNAGHTSWDPEMTEKLREMVQDHIDL